MPWSSVSLSSPSLSILTPCLDARRRRHTVSTTSRVEKYIHNSPIRSALRLRRRIAGHDWSHAHQARLYASDRGQPENEEFSIRYLKVDRGSCHRQRRPAQTRTPPTIWHPSNFNSFRTQRVLFSHSPKPSVVFGVSTSTYGNDHTSNAVTSLTPNLSHHINRLSKTQKDPPYQETHSFSFIEQFHFLSIACASKSLLDWFVGSRFH